MRLKSFIIPKRVVHVEMKSKKTKVDSIILIDFRNINININTNFHLNLREMMMPIDLNTPLLKLFSV